MIIVLNKEAYDNAERLIKAGEFDTLDADWNEAKPTLDEELYFIDNHYMKEYGLWFLGIDNQKADSVKEHYKYPVGDLKEVQRCALVKTITEAEKMGHTEVVQAAKKLLALVDAAAK